MERIRNQDFRCLFCGKECKIISGYEESYSDGEHYQMVYCKKHGFILFEKRYKGSIFNQEPYWDGRVAKTSNFRCQDCVYWGITKFSSEDEDSINKSCELNTPLRENPSYSIKTKYDPKHDFRMGHTIACKSFKHKEVKMVRTLFGGHNVTKK